MIKLLKWCGLVIITLLAFIGISVIIIYPIYAMLDQGNPFYMLVYIVAWVPIWIIVIIWLTLINVLNPYK